MPWKLNTAPGIQFLLETTKQIDLQVIIRLRNSFSALGRRKLNIGNHFQILFLSYQFLTNSNQYVQKQNKKR
jgi:hypothetical protein